jgi:signal transduction histidine kinase
MTGERWWHVFVVGTVVVLALIDALTWAPSEGQRIAALVILGLLLIAYATFGRLALQEGHRSLPFALVLIIGSGALVACSPSLAVVQAITFPLLWSIIVRTRVAIVANVALALGVFFGFLISLGFGPDNVITSAVIEAISLVGSLALGIWITSIADRSHERQRLLDELTAAQEQLATLNQDSGARLERERLAREIHDTVAQSLTGLVLLSQRAQRELEHGDTAALADQLGLMEESAREALLETRSLVAATAPVELGAGILPALERLAARFTRETGVTVTAVGTTPELDRDVQVVLLRCAQETLANVRKHSGARSATISLTTTAETVTMVVHDDGVGFDTGLPHSGFGLDGMRDRLALVHGALTVTSTNGTTLTVSLPLEVPA